jgi:hypothetical protein
VKLPLRDWRNHSTEERRFLAGPQSRATELWRALRILREFVKGFRGMHFAGPCVTVFGSSRFDEDHRYYAVGRELGRELVAAGFSVMTGGGPGVMEAANRGAKEAGGHSIGITIELPNEEPNAYLDQCLRFHYFFVRKVILVKYSYGFIVCPGGLGTLDEVFETATLIQTGKIHNFPIVLVGTDFWGPILTFMRETLLAEGTMDESDLDRIFITDSPHEAVQHVLQAVASRFGLKARPRWYLGEHELGNHRFRWPWRG